MPSDRCAVCIITVPNSVQTCDTIYAKLITRYISSACVRYSIYCDIVPKSDVFRSKINWPWQSSSCMACSDLCAQVKDASNSVLPQITGSDHNNTRLSLLNRFLLLHGAMFSILKQIKTMFYYGSKLKHFKIPRW